jgi:hypothetical protein
MHERKIEEFNEFFLLNKKVSATFYTHCFNASEV